MLLKSDGHGAGALQMVAFRVVSFRERIPAGSVQAYALAAFFVAVAGLIRAAIGLWVDDVVPFATFFPAVRAGTRAEVISSNNSGPPVFDLVVDLKNANTPLGEDDHEIHFSLGAVRGGRPRHQKR